MPQIRPHFPPGSRLLRLSDSLPPAIVNVRLQAPADQARYAMAQPEVPQHRVIALLVQEQLPAVAEPHVGLAVFVNVRGVAERARHAVEVKDAALADVDEEANVLLAPIGRESVNR